MIPERDRPLITQRLAGLSHPVRLILFSQTFGCETCSDTRQLLEELATLSPQLAFEEYNLVLDKETAADYQIDRVPGFVVTSDGIKGVRFYGAPLGYEFASLLSAVQVVGARDSGLTPENRQLVKQVQAPMNIQVYSTPT
jgi:alkyl hydroperoxide reductase subunit AhpF